MADEAFERVVAILESKGLNPTTTPRGVRSLCPAHEDSNPSLAVDRGDTCALVICRTGCDTADVLDGLGLRPADLFDDMDKPWSNDGLRATGATFGADGRWRMGHGRYRQGATPKMIHDQGVERDLWPDPGAVSGPTLYVVEGEPDALTGNSIGIPTVGAPGAGKDWPEDWLARLAAGRSRIVVVTDSDAPGRKLAARQAQRLSRICADVRVLDLFPAASNGEDLSDFVNQNPIDPAEAVRKAAATRSVRLSEAPSTAPSRSVEVSMPVDTTLERETLRVALVSRTGVDLLEADHGVKADDFNDQIHRHIWLAISRTDGAVDPGTISRVVTAAPDWLERGADAGQMAELMRSILADPIPSADPREMAESLRDLSQRRSTIRAAMSVMQEAQDQARSAEEVTARAEQKMQAADMGISRRRRDAISFRELGNMVIRNALEERSSIAAGGTGRAFFGLRGIDEATRGLRPEQLLLLAGAPGSGKTSWATDLALRFARTQAKAPDANRIHTTFISAEMPALQMGEKIAQMLSGINLSALDSGSVTNRDLEIIRKSWKKEMSFRDLPLNIQCPGRITSSELLSILSKQVRDNNTGLVIIDHFRRFRMDNPPRNSNDHEEEKALFLEEEICKGLGVAVICICHTRKPSQDFGNSRPTLADLRGNAQITASADYVCFTYRPGAERQLRGEIVSEEELKTVELIWAKGRYNGTSIRELQFDAATMSFSDKTEVINTAWNGPDFRSSGSAGPVPLPDL